MSEIPDVTPGEPVEAGWGNPIRDRTITRYADATARGLELAFPGPGAVTWIDDPGQLDVWDGTDWVVILDGIEIVIGLLNAAGDGITFRDENTTQRFRMGPVPEDSIAFRDANGDLIVNLTGGGALFDKAVTVTGAIVADPAIYGTGVDNASQTARNVLVGADIPDPSWGKNGDVYIRVEVP